MRWACSSVEEEILDGGGGWDRGVQVDEAVCRIASRFPEPIDDVDREGTRGQSDACHTLYYHDEPSIKRFCVYYNLRICCMACQCLRAARWTRVETASHATRPLLHASPKPTPSCQRRDAPVVERETQDN